MHIFRVASYLTLITYIIICQFWLVYCFLSFVAAYCLIAFFYPGAQKVSLRRKLTYAGWEPPSDGLIYNNIKIRLTPLLQLLATYPTDQRPTITHFIIKACGQVLRNSPDLNGKLVFGNFVPYKSCDVSLLVNVDGTKDVGFFLLKDVPNKSIEEIRQQIRGRARNMKPEGGDQDHKKRMGLISLVPPFLIRIVCQVTFFLTSYLGIHIPSLALEKDALGSIIVSSVGNFGYIDAYTSFFGTVGQWVLLTVNAPHEEVIVRQGKIQIAQMLNLNCTIDHRYMYSGGRGQKIVEMIHRVFQNPKDYLQKSEPLKSQ